MKINATENQKLTVLQQKLFEGIEKTKVIKLKTIIKMFKKFKLI